MRVTIVTALFTHALLAAACSSGGDLPRYTPDPSVERRCETDEATAEVRCICLSRSGDVACPTE